MKKNLDQFTSINHSNIKKKHNELFADWVKEINIEYLEVSKGFVKAKFLNQKKLQFFSGAVCGQALMTVIDTVMSMAVMTLSKVTLGTITQNNSFLNPAISPYFIIYSKIIKHGKFFCAGESKIYDAENKLICSSNSLYAIKSNLKT